ncbi:MAG: sodium ion-translocating decarboxylase subunit beta [Theionarchaea archaeon]|nr:sodium ion-translocating decarboxylase subunit beta [Theionarchaea archaeon]
MSDVITEFLELTGFSSLDMGSAIMIGIGCLLIYLAISRKYEPLLLLPIGFGAILTNIPFTGLMDEGGLLYFFYQGVKLGIFPLLVFVGIGAMTDFGPLLANPRMFFLGAAGQVGIFGTLWGALQLGFSLPEAASIGIIGAADGPSAIYITGKLAPTIIGPVAVAAYSYMALVPLIQPPIMRVLTTEKERKVRMVQLKPVSQKTKIAFPIMITVVTGLLVPSATPLIGMLMMGNLFRESGVVTRLWKASENELTNLVTIFLGISVGATMNASQFLRVETLAIILMGLLAFSLGIAGGVVLGKIMYIATKGKVNPLVGAAGISAVPMAARVVQKVGLKADPQNHLLMHAMGANVAGQIASVVAAGVLLLLVG